MSREIKLILDNTGLRSENGDLIAKRLNKKQHDKAVFAFRLTLDKIIDDKFFDMLVKNGEHK